MRQTICFFPLMTSKEKKLQLFTYNNCNSCHSFQETSSLSEFLSNFNYFFLILRSELPSINNYKNRCEIKRQQDSFVSRVNISRFMILLFRILDVNTKTIEFKKKSLFKLNKKRWTHSGGLKKWWVALLQKNKVYSFFDGKIEGTHARLFKKM